jgi:hypothetical protein
MFSYPVYESWQMQQSLKHSDPITIRPDIFETSGSCITAIRFPSICLFDPAYGLQARLLGSTADWWHLVKSCCVYRVQGVFVEGVSDEYRTCIMKSFSRAEMRCKSR